MRWFIKMGPDRSMVLLTLTLQISSLSVSPSSQTRDIGDIYLKSAQQDGWKDVQTIRLKRLRSVVEI